MAPLVDAGLAADRLVTQSARRDQPPSAIDHCSRCTSVISLAAPSPESPASPWLCGGCGSVYFATGLQERHWTRGGMARSVAYENVLDIASMHLGSRNHRLPRAELHRLLKFFSEGFPIVAEKRSHKRYAMALPVIAVPMGPNFRVIGPATQITTINVSRGGAALLDTNFCAADYLVLDFTPAGLSTAKAVFQVQRVTQIFSAFEVAGRLLARIIE
jgi:hypothetical protein